jgi:hypothetical protein
VQCLAQERRALGGGGADRVRSGERVQHHEVAAPEQAAVGFQVSGHGLLAAAASESLANPGELVLVETTRPYAYRQSSLSNHKVLVADDQQLALPVDLVRAGAPRLRSSPVYNLVRAVRPALRRSDGAT